MGIKLGNTTIGSLYLGSTKIVQAYLGSTKIYQVTTPVVSYPYLLMEFNSGYTPTTSLLSTSYRSDCTWIPVSSSPNVWKLEIHDWKDPSTGGTMGYGIPVLFCSNVDGSTSYLANVSCKLVGGDLSIPINGVYCQSMDRAFSNATGLTEIVDPVLCTTVTNLNGMFAGCVNCAAGQYDQYVYFSTYATGVSNHSGTFSNCGSDTQTGAAELAQIPVGWGGTLVPASTALVTSRSTFKNNYDCWAVDTSEPDTLPDWDNMNGVYIFTQSSVSSYTGVSMNRSRIAKFNSLGTTQSTYALYFYPCFMQRIASGITWAVVTSGYNGMLAVGQGNTDMPGTLDYFTYGPFAYSFGTKDLPGIYTGIFFCFLVTNSPIDSSFDLSSTPYGVLYNSNFKTDAGLRWFS